MTQYTVQPGDSWARIAGQLTGDQRRYLDLANANGGLYMLHPGDVIDVPDFSGAASPVITNQQWANTPTGVQNGQVQYANRSGAGAGGGAGGVQLPQTNGVQLPTFTGAGGGPGGGAGSTPAETLNSNIQNRYGRRNNRASTGNNPGNPNARGYNVPPTRTNNNPGNPNAAGYNVPAGVHRPGSRVGPMGNGAGPTSGQNVASGNTRTHPAGADGWNFPEAFPGGVQPTPNYSGNGPNPRLYNPGYMSNANAAVAGRYQGQADAAARNRPPAPSAFPRPVSEIDSSMANVAVAARYSAQAIFAFGGGYGAHWQGNRDVLPTVIYGRVANEIPLPPEYATTADFMTALGYVPDANGSWTRQDPMVSSGYGGGAYASQTSGPIDTGGYGGYGGGGYGGYGGSNYGRAPTQTSPYGLVNWRITG